MPNRNATMNNKRLPRTVNLSGFSLRVLSINTDIAIDKENKVPNTVLIIWVCLH